MKTKKHIVITAIKSFLVFLIVILIAFFSFRNLILNQLIIRISSKLKSEYDCKFNVSSAVINNVSDIEINDILLIPKQSDTLLKIKQLKTNISLSQLLVGNIQLGELKIDNGFIRLVKKNDSWNFDAFLKNKKNKEESDTNYAQSIDRLSAKFFNLIPTDMDVTGLNLLIDDMSSKVIFDFKELKLFKKNFKSLIHVTSDSLDQNWSVTGYADPRNRKADLKIYNSDSGQVILPYLKEKYNLKTSFDSLSIKLDQFEMKWGKLYIKGRTSFSKFIVEHPKIAQKEVLFRKTAFEYHFLIGEKFISVDSSSTITLNNIKCKPFLSYSNNINKKYTAKIEIPKMQAQEFVNSLPQGLFANLTGMEVTGNFSYRLNFEYDNKNPDAVIFESKLKPENIKIKKYGVADLEKINKEFTYRAIDKGILQRPIVVSPSNPEFTALNDISPFLQKCVLTSEDPSFFQHRGFINEAFKQSIVKNIKTKKFSRGASTISMQLVKNVFLTREKTLSRKMEEILLVYLLESNRISSKERMLEVYLNIIEWGPDVYGISEASRYYFNKKPFDLNMNECLFLATIIPKPKGFMYRFDQSGNLRETAFKQHKFLTQLMLRRNLITPTDTIDQHIPLSIIGKAGLLIKNKIDFRTENDSIYFENPVLSP